MSAPVPLPYGVFVNSKGEGAGISVIGNIDAFGGDRRIAGWFKLKDRDRARLIVQVHDQGKLAAEAEASLYRSDLASAGHGDGCYGFELPLPPGLFDDSFHEVQLRLCHDGDLLPDIFRFGAVLPKTPDGRAAILGNVDGVDHDHCVSGWFKLKDLDGERINVELYHGGLLAAQAEASLFRGDLAEAGHGDGCYGFRLILPLILFDGEFHHLELRLRHAGELLPDIPKFGAVMPKRPDRLGGITAGDIRRLKQELFPPAALEQSAQPAFRKQVTAIISELSATFGPAVAIDMLYVFALERPVDGDGLLNRLERLHARMITMADIVAEIFEAPEFIERRGDSYFAPLSVLSWWIRAKSGPNLE